MKAEPHGDLRGFWAIAWRLVIYLPAMVVFALFLVSLLVALVIPPMLASIFLAFGFWWQGIAALVFWLGVFGAWRRFRLGRFYEMPTTAVL